MTAMHTHTDQVIVKRFTSDPTPNGFRILIVVSLLSKLYAAAFAGAKIPVVLPQRKCK
jgi:hypothetical protein